MVKGDLGVKEGPNRVVKAKVVKGDTSKVAKVKEEGMDKVKGKGEILKSRTVVTRTPRKKTYCRSPAIQVIFQVKL